jgi:beta-xylosidase
MAPLLPSFRRAACAGALLLAACAAPTSGNPVLDGWYADPEGAVLAGRYWIFPTTSAPYDEQLAFDAFSSPDLVRWTRHPRVLSVDDIRWARRALWAPSVIEKDGRYWFFFSANDLQRPGGPLWDPADPSSHTGGIGVAVAERPEGPFRDHLGAPLVGDFHHDAQPIDPFVFRDEDGSHYLFYGGWGKCNLARLDEDFRGFLPWPDGSTFRDVTPEGYVEGPLMFVREGRYYFLWSEGGWGDASYRVAYAVADSLEGPFRRAGVILEQDPAVATGAGHNSVIRRPGSDDWFIVYHRRPIPNLGRDHRVSCIDRLEFDTHGAILPVRMSFEGVAALPLGG